MNDHLKKKLSQSFPSQALHSLTYRGVDVLLKTDAHGRATMAFIGKRNERGMINGKRYARRLVVNKDGKVIKDHWELKGSAS